MLIYFQYNLSGKIVAKILLPSKGGNGTKLKQPNPILILSKIYKKLANKPACIKFNRNVHRQAIAKFINGPAKATKSKEKQTQSTYWV